MYSYYADAPQAAAEKAADINGLKYEIISMNSNMHGMHR